MPNPAKPRRRNIMRKLRIDELSSVDRPAQEGARSLIRKRADDPAAAAGDTGSDVAKSRLALLTDAEGHSHLIDVDEPGGTTSYDKAEGEEYGHSHPWIRHGDGSVTIGAAAGHTHEVLVHAVAGNEAVVEVLVDKAAFQAEQSRRVAEDQVAKAAAGGTEDVNMPDKTTAPSKDTAAKDTAEKIAKLEADLAEAKIMAALTDAEKAHVAKLDADGKAAFMKLDPDGRKAELGRAAELAKSDNPVIYTSDTGEVFRKADDQRLVAMAKRADAEARTAKAERAQRQDLEYAKRADVELGNLPGDPAVKVAVLRALDGIPDEAVRKGAQELVGSGNSALATAFRQFGTRQGNDADPETRLHAMAEKRAKEKGEDYTAYAKVAEENPALKQQAVNGKAAPAAR